MNTKQEIEKLEAARGALKECYDMMRITLIPSIRDAMDRASLQHPEAVQYIEEIEDIAMDEKEDMEGDIERLDRRINNLKAEGMVDDSNPSLKD